MIDWILENEPLILVEISKFWLFNAFSLSPQDYDKELNFVLQILNSNFNLLIYSEDSFKSWLDFLESIPCYPTTDIITVHILFVISKISSIHLKAYFGAYMTHFLQSDSLKKSQKTVYLTMTLNEYLLT